MDICIKNLYVLQTFRGRCLSFFSINSVHLQEPVSVTLVTSIKLAIWPVCEKRNHKPNTLQLSATFDHCGTVAGILRPHICQLLNKSDEILRSPSICQAFCSQLQHRYSASIKFKFRFMCSEVTNVSLLVHIYVCTIVPLRSNILIRFLLFHLFCLHSFPYPVYNTVSINTLENFY